MGATVVAFGKFDGVHLGHRALLDRAAAASRRLGVPCGAATFQRHPYAYLRPGQAPPALTSLSEKLRLLRAAGVEFVVLFATDSTVLGVPPEEFARNVLRTKMGVRVVVVGKNFRFGYRGSGGIVTLRQLSRVEGLDGVEVGTVEVAGDVVSASRIRASLAQGDVELARDLLGRPFEAVGALRAVNPSSASVAVPATRAVPSPGAYAASVRMGSRPALSVAAAVTVGALEGGRHPILARCEDEGFLGVPPTGLARVAFEKRLGRFI